jgi:uncharacterized protein with GYD domain
MPKYLWQASYSSEGLRGVVREGGTGRRAAAKNLVEALGGTLEAFYFAFGDADAIIIADLPDEEAATAVALAVNADDRIDLRTTVLLTPEDVDAAARRSVEYRPPGA